MSLLRCEECGSWDVECAAPGPIRDCGCARCLNARLATALADAERNMKAALVWDAQAIGKALGMKVGTDVPGAVVPAIEALNSRLTAAEAECRAREEVQARLIRERNDAEVEAEMARGLLRKARESVRHRDGLTCDVPWPLVANIAAFLDSRK